MAGFESLGRDDRAREDAGTRSVGRRRFLTFLVTAPTLTVATRLGLDALTPSSAEAVVPSLPQPADLLDLGDVLKVAALPTAAMIVLEITPENRVRLEVPRAEVGQGVTTALAMLVAEDLDARLDDVDVPLSDARSELLYLQMTGGSTSVRTLWEPVRSVAAAARARLVTAAAQRWNVQASTLGTRNTTVFAPDGRSATYGSLSAEAAGVLVPAVSAAPKPPNRYTVIGRPTTRVDARDIVTGKARYALDTPLPGALPTVVARPPTINGSVLAVDQSTAGGMPGVVAVTRIPTGVAVSAETFDQALRARDALRITWGGGSIDGLSDADIRARLTSAVQPLLVPPLLTKYVDGTFDFAFVSHAPMEVLSAVADVRADSAELWFSTKTPQTAQQNIASAIGLPQDKVTVHVTRGGGSFGRRLFWEPATEAAQVSKAIGRPVRLMWTRNDDMRHGRMRPASHHRIRATYALGEVLSYEHRMAGVEVDFGFGLGDALTAGGAQISAGLGQAFFQLTVKTPYNFGVVTESLVEVPLGMHTGSWRSVYSAPARAAEEIMVDELARKMNKDPVAFRREFLKTAKARAVLDTVASAGNWGRAMSPGTAQGIAFHDEYRSCVACLVEINAIDRTAPRVTKVVVAADVGRVVNPRGVEAQLMGAVVDGISTVLQAGLHIDRGAVREGSYADFRYARQRHAPVRFEAHLMPSSGEPGGAGELAVPAAAGAVANAYARATGTAPRRFPINF
jgi:isoquinoline 1-oxidoreductase beta subunit